MRGKKRNVVAFTGAGISAESGIPTFEAMGQEVRSKLSRYYCQQNRAGFFELLSRMKASCDRAQPNAAHIALADHHIPVITMNIDGLHRRAGSCDAIELHGSLRNVHCLGCHQVYPFDQVKTSIYCPVCRAPLESDVVLYGDEIPLLQSAFDRVSGKGLLLVIGTSYQTSTASFVTRIAEAAGREIIPINDKAASRVPELLKGLL